MEAFERLVFKVEMQILFVMNRHLSAVILPCNNQEHNRDIVEVVVSVRALREIYLRGFEIAVKEGGARGIMTSYNPNNGLWSSSN